MCLFIHLLMDILDVSTFCLLGHVLLCICVDMYLFESLFSLLSGSHPPCFFWDHFPGKLLALKSLI